MKIFHLFFLIFITIGICAQTTVKKVTLPITKEMAKSTIVYANKNENNQIEIILSRKVKKDMVYKQLLFDTDLNKISETDITVDQYKSKTKNTVVEGQQRLPRFVQVNKTMLFQELKIEKGYMLRTTTIYDDFTTSIDELVVEETLTVKADDGRKLVPIHYYHLGDNAIKATNLGIVEPGYYAKGNMLVVCEVFPKLMVKEEKEPRVGVGASRVPLDYCVLTFNTESLTPLNRTMIKFDHVQVTESVREISNKRCILLTKDYAGKAPKSLGWEKYYNEGSNKRTVTIIDAKGNVESQFSFEGVPNMEIWNIDELESGSVVITGKINERKNFRFFMVKCSNKKMDFLTEVTSSELQSALVKPSDEKKYLSFDNTLEYKACDFKGMVELPNKNVIVVYQQKDEDKRTNLYYIQFDQNGKFVKQYTHNFAEDGTAMYQRSNGVFPVDLTLNLNADNTLSILIKEEKEGKGKYMRIGKIDYQQGTIGNFVSFGTPSNDDKTMYYLDKNNCLIELSDDNVILIGRSEKKDFLWLNKTSLK